MASNWGKYPSQTSEYRREYRASHPEVVAREKEQRRSRYRRNPEEAKAKSTAWAQENRERANANARQWRKDNPERAAATAKASRDRRTAKQQEENRARARKYYHDHKDDPHYIMPKRLRSRLYQCVRGNLGDVSAVRHLGCTVEELRQHIESKFLPGMTWDNWGVGAGKWHIDHISPLSAINPQDDEAIRRACHYTNLQPLWGVDNIRKGAKAQ